LPTDNYEKVQMKRILNKIYLINLPMLLVDIVVTILDGTNADKSVVFIFFSFFILEVKITAVMAATIDNNSSILKRITHDGEQCQ
jgi:hypothetical protein